MQRRVAIDDALRLEALLLRPVGSRGNVLIVSICAASPPLLPVPAQGWLPALGLHMAGRNKRTDKSGDSFVMPPSSAHTWRGRLS